MIPVSFRKAESLTLIAAVTWGLAVLATSEVGLVRMLQTGAQGSSAEQFFAGALWIGLLAGGAFLALRGFQPKLRVKRGWLGRFFMPAAATSFVMIFPYLCALLLVQLDSRPRESRQSQGYEMPTALVDALQTVSPWMALLAILLVYAILRFSANEAVDKFWKRCVRGMAVLSALVAIFILGGRGFSAWIQAMTATITAESIPRALETCVGRAPASVRRYLAASSQWNLTNWGERFGEKGAVPGVYFARRRFDAVTPGVPQLDTAVGVRITMGSLEIWQRMFGERFVTPRPSIGLFSDDTFELRRDVIRLPGGAQVGSLALLVGTDVVLDVVELRDDADFTAMTRVFTEIREEFRALLQRLDETGCGDSGPNQCTPESLMPPSASPLAEPFAELWLRRDESQLVLMAKGVYETKSPGEVRLALTKEGESERVQYSETEYVAPIGGRIVFAPAPLITGAGEGTAAPRFKIELIFQPEAGASESIRRWCLTDESPRGAFTRVAECPISN